MDNVKDHDIQIKVEPEDLDDLQNYSTFNIRLNHIDCGDGPTVPSPMFQNSEMSLMAELQLITDL